MIDQASEKYPYTPDQKGLHPYVFSLPEGRELVISGSGRTLIVDSSPQKISIVDAEDYVRVTEDMDMVRPRRLIAEVSERSGELYFSVDVVTRVPEVPNPHPDFFAAKFAAIALGRFESLRQRRIPNFTSDCEEWSVNYQQFELERSLGRSSNEAFWKTWIGRLSRNLGYTELASVVRYTDTNGVKAFSSHSRLPTPTP